MNCSISILYPQSIRIISNSVGTKPLLIEGDAGLERKPSNYYDYQLNRNQSEELNEHKENNTIHTNTDSVSFSIQKTLTFDPKPFEVTNSHASDSDQCHRLFIH